MNRTVRGWGALIGGMLGAVVGSVLLVLVLELSHWLRIDLPHPRGFLVLAVLGIPLVVGLTGGVVWAPAVTQFGQSSLKRITSLLQ